jgi:hypothetical protein
VLLVLFAVVPFTSFSLYNFHFDFRFNVYVHTVIFIDKYLLF